MSCPKRCHYSREQIETAKGLSATAREHKWDKAVLSRSLLETAHSEEHMMSNTSVVKTDFQELGGFQLPPESENDAKKCLQKTFPEAVAENHSEVQEQAQSVQQEKQVEKQYEGFSWKKFGQVAAGVGLALAGLAMCVFGGPVVAFLGGVMLGAGLGGAMKSAMTKGDVSWGDWGKAVGLGALSGVISGGIGAGAGALLKEGASLGAKVAAQAVAGAAGSAVTKLAQGVITGDINKEGFWKDVVTGAAVGAAGGAIGAGLRHAAEPALKEMHHGWEVAYGVAEGAGLGAAGGAAHAALSDGNIAEGIAGGAIGGAIGGLAAGGRRAWERHQDARGQPQNGGLNEDKLR
eukprot:TRINITY_DN24697_c0_g1_i1.p1 TRINITY_DN24697_c0_g1~~TRINITY_DN24697_c0_g1_i1.p1  ORF type:complete len:348 (-),score=91.98 TRINITY_DN24697_c0_g1_i1:803-1846(-)